MVLLWLQVVVVERVAHVGLGLVGGIKLREGGGAIAAGIVGAKAKSADVIEQSDGGGDSRAEVVVVGVAHAGNSFKSLGCLQLFLCKDVVGIGGLEVDVVALAVECFLYGLDASRQLVPVGQTEDAAQGLVDVVGALTGLVVGFLLAGLPVVVLRYEVVAVDVEVDVCAVVGHPSYAAAVGI